MLILTAIIILIAVAAFFVYKHSKDNKALEIIEEDSFTPFNLSEVKITKSTSRPVAPITYVPMPDSFPFNINQLMRTRNPDVYDIPHNFRYLIYDSLDTINSLLDDITSLAKEFPKTQLSKGDLNFIRNQDVRDYTFVMYNPYTKTGKVSKYPYSVHFQTNESFNSGTCFFGRVYHLIDGSIGKVEFVRWYRHILYTANCGIKDDTLRVIKIEKSIDGEKKTLYNFNSK